MPRGRPRRWYLGLGLAAGVGWWGHQLIIVFFIAAAVVLLARFRWRMLGRGAYAAAGFVVGGLPWWAWNVFHAWETFDFGNSLGKVPFREGLASFRGQFLQIVEVGALGQPLNALRLAFLALAAGAFTTVMVRDRLRDRSDARFWFRLAMPVMLAALALVYSTSHYARMNAGRYLLPAVPAVALLIGVGCDRLPCFRRAKQVWVWAILAVLIPPHAWHLGAMGSGTEKDRLAWQAARDLARQVAPLCDDHVCFGSYYRYWINVATDERLCLATPPRERYAPYAKRAELCNRPAFLDQYHDLPIFLRATAGKSDYLRVAGYRVDYGLTPPMNAWAYVSTSLVASVRDTRGRFLGDTLQNGTIENGWSDDTSRTAPAGLTIEFTQARPICGLRLLSPDERYPPFVRIESQADATAPWTVLVPETPFTDFLWSGPYPKPGLFQFHEELRWSAPTGGVRRLRVTFTPEHGLDTARVSLGELLVLEQAEAPEGALPTVDAVVRLLCDRGVGQAYAPRWLAGALAARSNLSCRVAAPLALTRTVQDVAEKDSGEPLPVVLDVPTALIMDLRDAPRSRAALTARGLTWDEMALGSCVLCVVAPPPADGDARRFPTLCWTETGCYQSGAAAYIKVKSQELYEQGATFLKQGAADRARAQFAQALAVDPTHQPARQALAEVLTAAGLNDDAARQRAVLSGETVPGIPAVARFSDGIEFLGVTVSTQRVQRGRALDMTYFWRCPPSVRPDRLAVFVHITKTENPRLQDDHRLLEGIPSDDFLCQPYAGEVFRVSRSFTVPTTVEPGAYRILLGLSKPDSHDRLKPRTELEVHRRAIVLPLTLELLP